MNKKLIVGTFAFVVFSWICIAVYMNICTTYYHLFPLLIKFSFLGLFSCFVTILFTLPIIFFAKKFNIVSKSKFSNDPGKDAIPLLGGVSLYLSFALSILIFAPLTPQIRSILIAGTLIFIIGTIDDIVPLSSTVRLVAQLAASFIVIFSGLVVSFMPNTPLGTTFAVIITLLWILGITNGMNFMDGADGLAAGITLITSIIFFLITLHLEQFSVAIICIFLAGSALGFLFFNFKPAKIYLGDGGSTFLGFILASIALYGGWSDANFLIALGIPVIVLGVIIFDMIYITCARVMSGKVTNFREWLDYKGKDHFHHRLMKLGFTEENAVFFIYIVTFILGLSVLSMENAQANYPILLQLMNSFLVFIIITILMLTARENDKRT